MDAITEKEWNDQLDGILQRLSDGKISKSEKYLEGIKIENWAVLMEQLVNDGYVSRRSNNHCQITPKGSTFLNDGGYAAERMRQKESAHITKSSYRWTKIGVWASIALALASLVYSIVSDILK